VSVSRPTYQLRGVLTIAAILVALCGSAKESAADPLTRITIHFDEGPGLADLAGGTPDEQQLAADVLAGFYAAGDMWASRLGDPVTVNVTVDFIPMDPYVLGSTASFSMGFSYSGVRDALIDDATTPDDQTAIAHLQPGLSLDMLTNDTSVAPPADAPLIRDNDGSGNNAVLDVNRTNAKVLGLLNPHRRDPDGEITFSSEYAWDFDRSNGIAPDAFDFVGVAAHELGHILGFVSGVDIVDITAAPDGPSAPLDLDNYRVFSVWDLFRYSPDSLAEPNQPSTGAVLDLAVGTDAYFSLDAGATHLAAVSTGRYNGDGQQASHWKDDLDLGIMDPTTSYGTLNLISALDLTALDAIGYDRVPSSWGDFNDDGAVDVADIEQMFDALEAGDQALTWDVNFDDQVTESDAVELIEGFLGSVFGDADLDGDVDLDDFVLLKSNWGASDATWAQASFDGDGDVDLDDFSILKANFGRTTVPEPAAISLLALGGLALRRRKL